MLARSAEIGTQQQKLDEAERDATRELANLREEIRASTQRFELENRSLDATGERIAELRGRVNESEARRDARRNPADVAETETRSQALASQVTHLTDDISRISRAGRATAWCATTSEHSTTDFASSPSGRSASRACARPSARSRASWQR